jgi:hypothetical protein
VLCRMSDRMLGVEFKYPDGLPTIVLLQGKRNPTTTFETPNTKPTHDQQMPETCLSSSSVSVANSTSTVTTKRNRDDNTANEYGLTANEFNLWDQLNECHADVFSNNKEYVKRLTVWVCYEYDHDWYECTLLNYTHGTDDEVGINLLWKATNETNEYIMDDLELAIRFDKPTDEEKQLHRALEKKVRSPRKRKKSKPSNQNRTATNKKFTNGVPSNFPLRSRTFAGRLARDMRTVKRYFHSRECEERIEEIKQRRVHTVLEDVTTWKGFCAFLEVEKYEGLEVKKPFAVTMISDDSTRPIRWYTLDQVLAHTTVVEKDMSPLELKNSRTEYPHSAKSSSGRHTRSKLRTYVNLVAEVPIAAKVRAVDQSMDVRYQSRPLRNIYQYSTVEKESMDPTVLTALQVEMENKSKYEQDRFKRIAENQRHLQQLKLEIDQNSLARKISAEREGKKEDRKKQQELEKNRRMFSRALDVALKSPDHIVVRVGRGDNEGNLGIVNVPSTNKPLNPTQTYTVQFQAEVDKDFQHDKLEWGSRIVPGADLTPVTRVVDPIHSINGDDAPVIKIIEHDSTPGPKEMPGMYVQSVRTWFEENATDMARYTGLLKDLPDKVHNKNSRSKLINPTNRGQVRVGIASSSPYEWYVVGFC